MAEFHDDDLYDDQPTDTELVRSLRQQLREQNKALKAATKRLEELEHENRASKLADILKGQGVNPKIAKLLPADIEATQDAVAKWLDDYADVFNITRNEGEADAGQDAQQTERQASQESAPESQNESQGGLTDNEVTAFAALQRTSLGALTPPVGLEALQQEISDLKRLPKEEAFAKLKQSGLMTS